MTYKEYVIGATKMQAERQGLQRVAGTAFEMDAPRETLYADRDYRWLIKPQVKDFIQRQLQAPVSLRYDSPTGRFILSFQSEDDLIFFKLGN